MNMMDNKPFTRFGPVTRVFLRVASTHIDTMRISPEQDCSTAVAVGILMVCTWIYQVGLFVLITGRLFGTPGQVQPELIAISVFLATFIFFIDRFLVINSSWHLSGIEELKRCGGLDILGGVKARIKNGISLLIRGILSIGMAQLTAIFLSLLVFGSDIYAGIQNASLQANVALFERATVATDAEFKRETEALKVEDARYAALAAQASAVRENQIDPAASDPLVRQATQEVTQLLAQKARDDEEVRRAEKFASDEAAGIKNAAGNSGQAGNGPRRRAALEQVTAARAHAQATDRALDAARGRLDTLRNRSVAASETTKQNAANQTPEFERALAAQNTERARLQERVAKLEQGRNEKIRQAVEQAPGYVAPDFGFLNQIRMLGVIAESDPKLKGVILLIELTSFGFELASVLGKVASFSPTVYSALLARDVYVRVALMVDEMMVVLNRAPASNAPGNPFPDMAGPASGPDASAEGSSQCQSGYAPAEPSEPAKPVKRPRGRPRKTVVH